MSSTPACSPTGGPAMNTDISGVGVRISFYLQSLFLGLLTVRSTSLDETTGAFATLVITNMAMISTSFILGFSNPPEMSFHDALVVFYLLGIAWVTIFLSMPSYNRYVRASKVLKILSIAQSYMTFAWTFVVIAKAKSFGSNPECNKHAVIVIFGSIKALNTGRFLGLGLVLFVFVVYTVLLMIDYYPLAEEYFEPLKEFWRKQKSKIKISQRRKKRQSQNALNKDTEAQKQDPTDAKKKQKNRSKKTTGLLDTHDLEPEVLSHPYTHTDPHIGWFSGKVMVQITFIVILVSLAILNTELLIKRNHFAPSGSATWQFGQVLPLFLVVVPFVSVIKAFKENKLELKRHRPRTYSEPPSRPTVPTDPTDAPTESGIKISKARTQVSKTISSASTKQSSRSARNTNAFDRYNFPSSSFEPSRTDFVVQDRVIDAEIQSASTVVNPPPPSYLRTRSTLTVHETERERERDSVTPMLTARISNTSVHTLPVHAHLEDDSKSTVKPEKTMNRVSTKDCQRPQVMYSDKKTG